MTETERNDMRAEVVDKVAALATAAFGLVAALAWNSAIQTLFRTWSGEQGALPQMFAYAVFVTAVAVAVTIWIGRVAGRAKGG